MTLVNEHLGLVDPAAMDKIGHLEMVANRMVDGFVSGRHRSLAKGGRVEFMEYRPYSPGDEIRLLDWRVFARSDRHYVKLFEDETNLQAMLVVDASGSMAFGQATVSKLQYAQVASACLARLMLYQRDAVGLAVVDTRVRQYVPPRSTSNHFGAMLKELSKVQPRGETFLAAVLNDLGGRIKKRGLIIILSDCFDDPEPLLKALACLRSRGHDLLLFHIMAPEELSFSFTKWTRFECLEVSGRRLDLDPAIVRKQYLSRVRVFLDQIKTGCGRLKCDYAPLTTDRALGDMLAFYLARRMSRVK